MKIAAITLMDDSFIIGFRVWLKSLLHFNPWFDLDFVVLDCGLSAAMKEEILERYKKTTFVKTRADKYNGVNFMRTKERLRKTYYTLDVFAQRGFDRLVFFDMDTLILGDVQDLFNCRYPIAGCKQYHLNRDEFNFEINTGVFVVNKLLLQDGIYTQLLNRARSGFSMPDQTIINQQFRTKMFHLDKIYNVEKRMKLSKKYPDYIKNARVLHFVGSKPWETEKPNDNEKQYKDLENLWWEWYER